MESATESKPPTPQGTVRVKRWCKRPPARRVTGAAGKPRPEQGHAEMMTARRSSSEVKVSGRPHEVVR